MEEKYLYTNRLIREKSPYLLQHAHNPVDWYPWGEEAISVAKEQDKPIFLSIGYATCHWCHMMEKECFENPQVAHEMNDTFINVKVDREELPEIDNLYMEFAQSMMAGAAGWPLNVLLTPDLKPFFAATYLPPYPRHGLMGLIELTERIREIWHSEEKERILLQASKIVEVFEESTHLQGEEISSKEIINETAELLYKMADPVFGGIKGAPKFPIGYQNNFWIRYSRMKKDSRALFLVERTLDMMHRGGIYDHLGGGFSRYSVDDRWMIPHFEKMLYDNALLASAFLEAWQALKNPLYATVCNEILQYVLRDMTSPEGGFFSAEDADSEGHEGLFYTWTLKEVQNILGEQESQLFCTFYGITEEGNFEGRNVLHTDKSLEEFSSAYMLDSKSLGEIFEGQRNTLWEVREKKTHPFKDDKILTGWNGLMIYALAETGAAFNNEEYLNAAEKAAKFIQTHLWEGDQLLRRWRDGSASFAAGLEEYAFLIRGLLSLFETGCGTGWLEWALKLTSILSKNFKLENGAFYQTDGKDPNLLLRKSQFADGAEPSGNAIHCENLIWLYQITENPIYLEEAEDILKAVKQSLDNYPPGYCYHLISLIRYYDQEKSTIFIALNEEETHFKELRTMIYNSYLPHKAVIWVRQRDFLLSSLIPGIDTKKPIENKTTVYICLHGVCKKPLIDLNEIKKEVEEL